MNNPGVKFIFILSIYWLSQSVYAQSTINDIDNYGYTSVSGYECLVLNNGNIITSGTTGSVEHQQQSFHFTQLDTDGDILHSQFYYDTTEIFFTGRRTKGLAQINDSLVFYCYRATDSQCFYFNTSTNIIDTIGIVGLRPDSTHVRANSINYVDSTIILRCSIYNPNGKEKFSIIKVKDGNIISNIEYDIPEYDFSPGENYSFLSITANEHYHYINTDISPTLLIHILNGEIVATHNLETIIPTRAAVLASDSAILQPQNYFRTKGDTLFNQIGIIKFDLEGNILWENKLSEKINEVPIRVGDNFYATTIRYTFIEKMIPSAQNDGFIYIGGEYANDSLGNSNAVIGKITTDGELLWHREYRHDWSINSYNEFVDVEPDGYGGYIMYGTFLGQSVETQPNRKTGWLMRVDKDGLLIDTSVNNTNPPLQEFRSLSISPNPAGSIIRLSKSLSNLSVLDINGQASISIKDTYTNKIDIPSLPKGLYIIIGQDEKGDWYRSKFVKQ